jgi:DNA-binding NtrC family response regulator
MPALRERGEDIHLLVEYFINRFARKAGKSFEAEKGMVESVLRETKGRVFGPSGAAVKLGMLGTTLDSKIKSLKIDKNRFKVS